MSRNGRVRLHLRVNGEDHDLVVPLEKTLLEVLREDLGLTGTKHGCELGECGTCTVLVDGQPYLSCLGLPVELEGREIETVEGLARRGRPHELQVAFAETGAAQCGYCTPGFLVAAKALLEETPEPSRDEITAWLAGNLCRCTGYLQIIEAVELAARRVAAKRRKGEGDPGHRSMEGGRIAPLPARVEEELAGVEWESAGIEEEPTGLGQEPAGIERAMSGIEPEADSGVREGDTA